MNTLTSHHDFFDKIGHVIVICRLGVDESLSDYLGWFAFNGECSSADITGQVVEDGRANDH